ncbi:hypothetical protein OSB04_un000868 [Centaurea solstitialis]|uniref:Transposase n=1 Tax=Centaurea solstitialis TaxID=347529 RepID=A0AA38SGL0_9ASTR|nr:hypothetical protein OSB04_un000868 [Centaurea solstitialis]
MLPEGNEMMGSTYVAKKTMKAMGSGYTKIHACINDRVLYKNEFKDFKVCPRCGKSRWKVDDKTGELYESVPAKVLWYFLIIPRMKPLFQTKTIAKDLIWHETSRKKDGVLRHPADSQAWMEIDHRFPEIANDPRNLRLGISADGTEETDITVYLPYDRTFRRQRKAFNGKQELDIALTPMPEEEIYEEVKTGTYKQGNGTILPTASYTLTKEEKDKFCETLYELRVPQGYCSNLLVWNEYKDFKVCPRCGKSRWKVDDKMGKLYESVPAKVLWNEYKDFKVCPRCGKSRWKVDDKMGKLYESVPAKVLCRLSGMDGNRSHVPEIANDPRSLRLGISADGVDVNRGNRHHNVWPVLTVIYNIPPWLCMKRKFIMLSSLISSTPCNDIDVFLEPLLDDLHFLFETGVETYDTHTQEMFTLHAVVLWTINDYLALGTLCGCPYSRYKGCVVCRQKTQCVRLPFLGKRSYVRHRRYLPYDRTFRRQRKAFNGKQELDIALTPMPEEEIYEEVKYIENSWGKGLKDMK